MQDSDATKFNLQRMYCVSDFPYIASKLYYFLSQLNMFFISYSLSLDFEQNGKKNLNNK